MLLQDTLIHLGLALPVPFESVAVAARGEDLARFKAAPGYASELNRFHATLKVARGVVEQQKSEETMAVPAQGLRDILSKIQELEDEVSAMLGSKSTEGPVGDSQDTSSGSSAKKPSTSPDEQYGPGGQGMPLSQPPGKGSAPVSDAVGSGSAAVPTAPSSTKSNEEDDCAPEHLIYALGGASLQTRSHVSDHPLFRRNANCTLGSVADHAQRLHKGSPLKKPASGQTQDGGSDSASAADTSSGPSSENPSSGKAQDAGNGADAVSPPPSASAAELQQSKPSTKPEPMPEGVPDVTPVPLDDSTTAPTDNQPDSDTTAVQPGADTGAPSSVPANTDVTLDGVDIPVSTIDALSSSAVVMGETADGALEATTPASVITPEESELSTITLTSTRTRQSTKTMTITQTTTVRVSRASATANAKNKDSAVASAITYEKFKNGTVYAKFSNGTIVGGVSNDTLTTPSIGKFDNSTAIPELQSVGGTTPTLSMTEALKPSQIAVDGPLYNITDTVSISSDDGMTSPLTPTSIKMLQTSSEALLNATSSTSSPSNNAKATATSLNDSKAKERVKPVSDDSVLQSADSATPSPTPEASSALKASHASSQEHLSNATDSTSVRAKMLPASSASESSSPKVSKTSALERLVDLEHSASLHSIDDATPTSSPEMMVSSTPKDTQAMHTSVSAHVKAATHGSSKSPSNSASSPASGATTSLNSPTSSVGTSSLPKTPASVSQTKAFSNTTTKSYPPVDKVIHPPASLQGHLKKNQHPEVTPVPLSKNPRHVLNDVAKMTGPSGFKTVTNRRARN